MKVDVVLLPSHLPPNGLEGHACVVFDVLRATTTMTAALAGGVREIHLFASLDAARTAAARFDGRRFLAGEENCLPPSGFHLGNSPGQFTREHHDSTLFMCTTNGTRALFAARHAAMLYVGALVNASSVAERLRDEGRDVVLLCAGTNGAAAMEDALGAGAVIAALGAELASDTARMSLRLFQATKDRLADALRDSQGGRNVLAAKLSGDIDFAARLNEFQTVGIASGDPLVVKSARRL